MKINADFSQRVVVHSEQMEWKASPMPGVFRRQLDRIGDEVARATSIVKYSPESQFSPHVHTGGEEFIVLEGVFQDEHGDYPVGSYVRNPPKSRHTPGSRVGCVIFVKLWQFQVNDSTQVRLNTQYMRGVTQAGSEHISVMPLYNDDYEDVCIETWGANSDIVYQLEQGAEFLILDGSFEENGETLQKHSWLRVPPASIFSAKTMGLGARVWIKRGHLGRADQEAARLPYK